MNKVIRDGKVAVLYSPEFGAGWYTWNRENSEIIFDPNIVGFVENKEFDKLQVYVSIKYPDLYTGGMDTLAIEWVPQGAQFKINEYDGNESIEYKDTDDWLTA